MKCKSCGSMGGCDCYASGGEVMGVHKSDMEIDRPANKMEKKWAGESTSGRLLDQKDLMGDKAVKQAKGQHHRVLGEMKALPKPKLQGLSEGGKVYEVGPMEDTRQPSKEALTAYEKGGEVDADGDYDGDMDNEILDQCCDEFLSAIEKKDKKEILESLKAIILSVGK